MARTIKKLPKWAIKQAGGINKKAWALARRGRPKSPAKRSRGQRTMARKGNPQNPGNRRKRFGAWLHGARGIDVLTGPVQGSVAGLGLSGAALTDAGKRYAGQFAGGNQDDIVTTVKAVGTGLVRTAITSKSGAYRGMGQKKILSYVQALSPEIIAASNANPLQDPKRFNAFRHIAHEAYNTNDHRHDLQFAAFTQSIGLQAGAWVAQKAAQMFGINKMLPKGINL